ncbi:ProQ/FinO family protein [Caballeronia temeraria]|uniref:ProQ/FinO family protein n=1 Tax=Caballeronia temeraria TaxID=1777137 RepID=UPI000772B873|nr:ProQ/FinO family protein [Caballeronia temeraria]
MGFEQLAALKAQLNQGTSDKEVVPRARKVTVEVARETGLRSKPRRTSADAAARAVATLQRQFPQAFPRAPAPKVPLKVGILQDVLARAASLGLSERDARNGVKLWCRGQRYWSCLVEGNVRVDLTGAITGLVTAAEAEYGTSQERTRLARRREQLANKRRA